MSKSETLKAELRERVGTRHARRLRAKGRIPASIDGDGDRPHVDLSIPEHEFLATRRRHVHLYDLDIGGKVETAVVRELQWDTFGEQISHVDFKRVRRDVATETDVELEFVGHPKGGMLNHLVTHVRILCLPTDIPDSIEVPVGHLEANGAVYGRDLAIPKGVTLVSSPDQKIAVVVVAKIEVEAPAAPAEGGTVAVTPAAPPAAP
jgi:large subunit ribosomal protein L25